jgi:hypothetical protein
MVEGLVEGQIQRMLRRGETKEEEARVGKTAGEDAGEAAAADTERWERWRGRGMVRWHGMERRLARELVPK